MEIFIDKESNNLADNVQALIDLRDQLDKLTLDKCVGKLTMKVNIKIKQYGNNSKC